MKVFHKGETVILDGGLGTTLEKFYGKNISNTPLWSAKPVTEDPETVIQAHLSFLQAGARIIQTSTYQCAFDSFKRAGYSQKEAKRIMLESVKLADEARSRFAARQGNLDHTKIGIALSLGPYGASLSPSGEFNGFYPPPYGPMRYSAEGEAHNVFADESDVAKSINALAHFHLERLAVFVNDPLVWKMIDYVAFETVPLAREVKAIRRAVTWLQKEIVEQGNKPWWISCVFPNGEFPEVKRPGGPKLSAREVVIAALGEQKNVQAEMCDLVPTGLGINCTPVKFLPGLLAEMGQEVAALWEGNLPNPLLVIYPGGNDPGSKAPRNEEGVEAGRKSWAEDLSCVVRCLTKENFWSGIVVGGCCMAGPDEIRALSQNLL